MIFNRYLGRVFGSQVKVKILRNFIRYPTKRFTSRELADLIRVSHTAVLKSLEDLDGMNIIHIERHGTSNLLSINQQSFLYEQIRSLFEYEANTLNLLKAEIRHSFPKVKMLALFGSIVKGEEVYNSDVDVLIVTKNKAESKEILARLQEKFSKRFGNTLSGHILTEKEFKQKEKTHLIRDILNNCIWVKKKL